MEHKVEQNLNKTSATHPGALVLILSDLVSFLAPNHSKENSLSAQQIRNPKESEYFHCKCYYFYFLWMVRSETERTEGLRGGIKFQSLFSNFLI